MVDMVYIVSHVNCKC